MPLSAFTLPLRAPSIPSHGAVSSLSWLPKSRSPIWVPGFSSKSHLGGDSRAFVIRMMAEPAKTDGLGSADSSERGGFGERDAVLGNGRPSAARSTTRHRIESALNRMSKWLVAALFGLVILWKHDAEALWAAMGSVVNSWLSMTLKRTLNHQRPASALRSDPGMPSSHAQSIFYAALFAIVSLIYGLGTNLPTVVLGIAILACASYLSWLRVSQQLHTVSQVLVGAIVGSACCITWFWLWHSFVLEVFISSLWVRILVVLASLACCAAFLVYVVLHWLMKDEQ